MALKCSERHLVFVLVYVICGALVAASLSQRYKGKVHTVVEVNVRKHKFSKSIYKLRWLDDFPQKYLYFSAVLDSLVMRDLRMRFHSNRN